MIDTKQATLLQIPSHQTEIFEMLDPQLKLKVSVSCSECEFEDRPNTLSSLLMITIFKTKKGMEHPLFYAHGHIHYDSAEDSEKLVLMRIVSTNTSGVILQFKGIHVNDIMPSEFQKLVQFVKCMPGIHLDIIDSSSNHITTFENPFSSNGQHYIDPLDEVL